MLPSRLHLLSLAALFGLVTAQSSPTPCLLPSVSSFIMSAGAQVAEQSACPSWGIDNDPLYLVWPDPNDLVLIFLGNTSANGSWTAPVFLPDQLPVYGFGWMMYRPGSVQTGEGMFNFASELSPAFAILPSAMSSNTTTLRAGDIRLLEPTDVAMPYDRDALLYPEADRVVLQVPGGVNSTGQTVTLLLYHWLTPYPLIVLGEDVPLPAPGTQLEYMFDLSLSSTFPTGAWQVVLVPSMTEIELVLAASEPFVFPAENQGATGSVSLATAANTLSASATLTLSASSESTITRSINAPPSSLLSTLSPPIHSKTQTAALSGSPSPSSGSGSGSTSGALPTPGGGRLLLVVAGLWLLSLSL
ncbi:hypothetical protein DACRYDRAFT_23697 [Dacryopinax primogenitus]|uniref:Uncharacterized protein n=1 Tax=Dacryopinax primogenitus (strain DJM 731) TaxID=1858805 RepID=M5FR99_DACPD|nr:uncharacterized protein DACRYDRAFT_23697 [Dacryopinax primogenitus]EJT99620.1 hypothetical protein DACRYDRAFT_23697 [Dacryopinax primogenitus]